MPYVYEKRALRRGEPLAIQVLHMSLTDGSALRSLLHYHDYTELLFGLEGVASVAIGSESYPLAAGDLIVVHNGTPHHVAAPQGDCSYTVVKFLPQILFAGEQSCAEYTYAFLLMENSADKTVHFPAASLADTDIASRFARLQEEFDRQSFGYELALRAEITAIVLHILRSWHSEKPEYADALEMGRQGDILRRAIPYIKEHYTDLSESSVAREVGVTPAYLSRVFRRGMHTTFSDFVGTVRLGEAERLLLTTDESVTAIAEAVGFSTAAYFIALFRKTHGESPARYRRLHREGAPMAGNAEEQ